MDQGVYQPLVEATRNEQLAVSTSSKILTNARNSLMPRKVIVVRNISAADADIITINLGFNTATNNNGIVLKRNESFTDTSETGYESYQGQITCICATANGNLSIFER